MSENNSFKSTVRFDKDTHERLVEISKNRGIPMAEVIREVVRKGLASEWINENDDMIANLIRKQLDIVLKPYIERLAKLSSKTGHMSATSTFLLVQTLMDLVQIDRRKDVRTMYESARKKAASYMKTKAEDWENNVDE